MILDGLNYLVTRNTQELIKLLVENKGISVEKAMDLLYNSKTYDRLCDLETHLYYESPSYIYEMLQGELG